MDHLLSPDILHVCKSDVLTKADPSTIIMEGYYHYIITLTKEETEAANNEFVN